MRREGLRALLASLQMTGRIHEKGRVTAAGKSMMKLRKQRTAADHFQAKP